MIEQEKSKRGFASMDPDKQRGIAQMGGRKARAMGRGHSFTTETGRLAGRKGGLKVSADRAYMASIGAKGGLKVSADKDHMSRIGKLGGAVK